MITDLDIKNKIVKLLRSVESVPQSNMDALISQLLEDEFFTAPASTNHHLSVKGGLARHSWNVYVELTKVVQDLEETMGKSIASRDSVIICSLLHDVCKMFCYHEDYKNVKKNGVWTQEKYYKKEDVLPYGGHGDKSVIMLLKYIPLTDDQIYAIRWHMGAWDLEQSLGYQKHAYSQALKICPLAQALQIADLLATFKEGVLDKH